MRRESGVDIDQEVELFCCMPLQRLDFGAAVDFIEEDGEIQAMDACDQVTNLLTCGRAGIEYGGSELYGLVLSLMANLGSLELFRVSAVQDDVEVVGVELLSDSKPNTITGTRYQSPGTVAVEVVLYG